MLRCGGGPAVAWLSAGVLQTSSDWGRSRQIRATGVAGLVRAGAYLFYSQGSGARSLWLSTDGLASAAPLTLPPEAPPALRFSVLVRPPVIFVNVRHGSSPAWGHLYVASTADLGLVLALRNNTGTPDLAAVPGLPGVFLANYLAATGPATARTMNSGATWQELQPPATGLLQLAVPRAFTAGASLLVAAGNAGPVLAPAATYVSRDGAAWTEVWPAPALAAVAGHGAYLLLAPANSSALPYSLNYGYSTAACLLPAPLAPALLLAEGAGAARVLVAGASPAGAALLVLNFSAAYGSPAPLCRLNSSDYESWSPGCLRGTALSLRRRAARAQCVDPRGEELLAAAPCLCTADDYGCDLCYTGYKDDDALPSQFCRPICVAPPSPCVAGQQAQSLGYRLTPGDTCLLAPGAVDRMPVLAPCSSATCPAGRWGPDCRPCPTCVHGLCQDGPAGSGQCMCVDGWAGAACSLCMAGRWGPDCQPCPACGHGLCEEGIAGTGACRCARGWSGAACDQCVGGAGPDCQPCPPCLNGGQCTDAGCLCIEGYTGAACTDPPARSLVPGLVVAAALLAVALAAAIFLHCRRPAQENVFGPGPGADDL